MSASAWAGYQLLGLGVGAAIFFPGAWLVLFRPLPGVANAFWLVLSGWLICVAAQVAGLVMWFSGVVQVSSDQLVWAHTGVAVSVLLLSAMAVAVVKLFPTLRQVAAETYYMMFPWRQLGRRRWLKEHQAEQGAASA